MGIKIGKKTKIVLKIIGFYGVLWLLTATWGNHDVDIDFDRMYAVGDDGSALAGGPIKPVPVVRINELANPKSLVDPQNKLPNNWWRYRGSVIVVGPFFIVDEVAYIAGGLNGGAEKRLTFWFFGYSKTFTLEYYWGV